MFLTLFLFVTESLGRNFVQRASDLGFPRINYQPFRKGSPDKFATTVFKGLLRLSSYRSVYIYGVVCRKSSG